MKCLIVADYRQCFNDRNSMIKEDITINLRNIRHHLSFNIK